MSVLLHPTLGLELGLSTFFKWLLQSWDHQFILPLEPDLNCRIQGQAAGAPRSAHRSLPKTLAFPLHTQKLFFTLSDLLVGLFLSLIWVSKTFALPKVPGTTGLLRSYSHITGQLNMKRAKRIKPDLPFHSWGFWYYQSESLDDAGGKKKHIYIYIHLYSSPENQYPLILIANEGKALWRNFTSVCSYSCIGAVPV